jgi:hypothetical protein
MKFRDSTEDEKVVSRGKKNDSGQDN